MKDFVQFACLILLLFVGCQPASKTVILSGMIENTSEKKVKLSNDDMDLELDLVDGKFSSQFDLDEPAFFNIRVGRESSTMFLSPGQSMELSIDVKEFDESIKYKGEGSEDSNYLAAKYLHNEKNSLAPADIYKLEEKEFLEQLDKNNQDGLDFLGEHIEGLSKEFKRLEKINIQFKQNNLLLDYKPAHAYYAKVKDFEPSEALLQKIDDIDINQPNYLGSGEFSGFINNYLGGKAYDLFLKDKAYSALGNSGVMKANLELITSNISNKTVQTFAADQFVKQTLSYSSALGLEPYMGELKSLTQTPKTFELINNSMKEWGHLAKGKPAPDFEGRTLNGDTVKLSDMRGKNVYIDVWATWCGPCIREQPALFALEEQYKSNNNLAFMGVSIDSDQGAWKKMVAEKDMKGEQIFTAGAWKSDICTNYLIKGIPRFILVDAEGNVIDSDAPRPSSELIKNILKELSGEPLLSSI